jgi:hypothetical protein
VTAAASRSHVALAWAGLVIGPVAWAVNMQLGQILPYPECGASFRPSPLISGLGVLLSLGGAALSYRVSNLRRPDTGMLGFVGSLGALMGPLVAFALLLQFLSGLLITACAR